MAAADADAGTGGGRARARSGRTLRRAPRAGQPGRLPRVRRRPVHHRRLRHHRRRRIARVGRSVQWTEDDAEGPAQVDAGGDAEERGARGVKRERTTFSHVVPFLRALRASA